METETVTRHQLNCDGPNVAEGVRVERPWSCTCGATFHGYDSHVRAAFRDHKRGGGMLAGQTVTHPGETRQLFAVPDTTVPGWRGMPVDATLHTLQHPVTREHVRLTQPRRYEFGVTEADYPKLQLPLGGCAHCALPPGFALCHVTGVHREPAPVRLAVQCGLCWPRAERPDPHHPGRVGPDQYLRCACAAASERGAAQELHPP